MEHWYVVHTSPLKEYAVRDRLGVAGFDAFLPCTPGAGARAGREDAPLFAGYLFIRYDLEAWGTHRLQEASPFVRFVSFDGGVPAIPDPVIAQLQDRTREIAAEGGLWDRFQPGERVSVRMGDTESLGEVMEKNASPEARVRILLDFLGGLVSVTVPPERVMRARSPRRTRGHGRFLGGFTAAGGMVGR